MALHQIIASPAAILVLDCCSFGISVIGHKPDNDGTDEDGDNIDGIDDGC